MKALVRRFINFMEVAPAYIAIPLLPLVALLYVYARIKNFLVERNAMTTQTKSLRLFSRLRAALRLRKAKADNDIERPEPDRIIPAVQDIVFGVVITAFLMMISYSIMNGSMAEWIGTFLAHQDSAYGFEERFAAFTAACVALVSMVVIFGVSLSREPGGDDIVDAIGDLADETNERFAEFEDRVNTQLDQMRAALEDK